MAPVPFEVSYQRLSARTQMLFRALSADATAARPCSSNSDLAAIIGLADEKPLHGHFRLLKDLGMISIAARGKLRQVKILRGPDAGKATAVPVPKTTAKKPAKPRQRQADRKLVVSGPDEITIMPVGGVAEVVRGEAEKAVSERRRAYTMSSIEQAAEIDLDHARSVSAQVQRIFCGNPGDAIALFRRRWPEVWSRIETIAEADRVSPFEAFSSVVLAGLDCLEEAA